MPVRFEIIGGSGWIRIERPERLNALDAPTLDAMTDAIDACCADSGIRSLVIIGEGGRAFSTGGDLKQLRQDQIDGSPKRAEIAAERLYDRLRDCARPVVAAVDGYCLGAGFELALLSD
ncbi:MAG TPA: enoyl-CoA hydratase/isomerase family protein, partial [Novosphingobium sp.]